VSPAAAPFPWDDVFRGLVAGCRLAPDEAWRLSLAEARLLLARGGPAPPRRNDLARLMARFPDRLQGD
jgi:uncharacterized phage protein (TIGR02216 family)